jgi:hypothetical protein
MEAANRAAAASSPARPQAAAVALSCGAGGGAGCWVRQGRRGCGVLWGAAGANVPDTDA